MNGPRHPDWNAVANSLEQRGLAIRERAQTGMAGNLEAQQEMRTRACLLIDLADAIWDGLNAAEGIPEGQP